ncbi:MAG: hypothetical protein AAB367_02070 [Patescibacteria group bacterium]
MKMSPETWQHISQIFIVVGTILAAAGGYGHFYFGKKINAESRNSPTQEVYNIESKNQSGGVTVGKIERLEIITDKESLGIREPLTLYKDHKKVGVVVGPVISEVAKTFYFEEIRLDGSIRGDVMNFMFSPFEYEGKYIIQAEHINTLVSLAPPGAQQVRGKILEILPKE